jgi:hypothetical protein
MTPLRATCLALAAATCLALLLPSTPASAGRGAKDLPPIETSCFVYGYIDMAEERVKLQFLNLLRTGPGADDERFLGMGIRDGIFWNTVAEPGYYILSTFGQIATQYRPGVTYSVPRQGNPFRFVFPEPGIYYVGSYRYVPGERARGWAGKARGSFDLEPISNVVPEKAVLANVIAIHKDRRWDALLRARLESL